MKRQRFATGMLALCAAAAAVVIGARAGTPLPSEGHTGTQSGGSVHDSTWAITTTQQGNQNTLTNGSGGGASQVAVVTENDSQTAFYTVPGDATSVVVTMYNDAPLFWEGEVQSGSGNAWYGVYTHQLTVEDAGGNALQTITIDNTGGWLGAHNGNQGCNNGYAECQRGITSYIVEQADIRGDSSSSVSPDGALNESSYVWPMTNAGQKVAVTLYNVPAFYKLNMGTSVNACGTGQPMPAPNSGGWNNFSAPSCWGRWAAQGGANTGGTWGDTRYIVPFQVANRSSWHIDYQVVSNITQKGLNGGSCSAFTYSSSVPGCSWNVPSEGNGATYSNSYTTNDNGNTHTYCGITATCGGDYTKQTASWGGVQDYSQAGVSDGTRDPPCGKNPCP